MPDLSDEAEPNIDGAFAIGFDASNPPSRDPFNKDGNIYGRPEREVSLHFNGREIANRLCPAELKTGQPVPYRVRVQSVTGGSDVSLWVGGQPVYDKFFVPDLKPSRAGWTANTSFSTYQSSHASHAAKLDQPTKVSVFDQETNDAGRHRFERAVDLQKITDEFGRIVGTLTLGPTPKGIDPWDRLAQIWLVDDKGERFEVLRFITPYRKGWTWRVDLTRLMPLLKGRKQFKFECETWGEGWLVDFDLAYYPGALSPRPVEVRNLWNGTAVIGQPKEFPLADFFKEQTLSLGPNKKVEFVACVTGHGMSPNKDNAGEFHPLWRKLHVNEAAFQNNLWKQDCYLNPCRPQGGTWKYDRAGWAPGDVVTPWVQDISQSISTSGPTKFNYEIQPYTNPTPAEGSPARHVVESYLVLWK